MRLLSASSTELLVKEAFRRKLTTQIPERYLSLIPKADEEPPAPAEIARYDWRSQAHAYQLPPSGDWQTWVIIGGRGAGKTRSGAEWIRGQVEEHGRRRVALVAATAADARDVMIEGESGILSVSPPWNRPAYEPSKRRLIWPNGATATTYSAEEPESLRGPQHDCAWADDLAAWRMVAAADTRRSGAAREKKYTAWDMLQFGLRIGTDPRCIVTTTPRPTKEIRELLGQPTTVVTTGTTYDNRANLAPAFFDRIISRYEGTRLGRQELLAEILGDNPGALWQRATIEACRVTEHPSLTRIVVAVDPSGSSSEGAAEAGIVVAGVGADGHGYVLSDRTLRGTPEQWGRAAVQEYHLWKADRIVAEINYGGEMVRLVIQTADASAAYKQVTASRGKQVRAEPVAALYEQCLAAGTLVETERGAIPIEQVTTLDRVWTRGGLRRVLWSGQTGIEPTVILRAGSHNLTCTAGHPIYVAGVGFIRAEQLAPNRDTLLVWEQPTTARIAGSRFQSDVAGDDAVHARQRFVGQPLGSPNGLLSILRAFVTTNRVTAIGALVGTAGTNFSIAPFGSLPTGRYPKDGTFIISTAIPGTTISRIWSRWNLRSIMQSIRAILTRNPSAPASLCRRRLGGHSASRGLFDASNAGAISPPRRRALGSVRRPVTRGIGLGAVGKGPTVPVFNLMVESDPEFFANGLLVHNCRVHHVGAFPQLEDECCEWVPGDPSPNRMDALVWAITELMLGPQGWGVS